ncbi:hypothetical protein GQ44DRAFT_617478, partial [Phaeosphaeriaceae sp. PMI808]
FYYFIRILEKVLTYSYALYNSCIKIYRKRSITKKNTYELGKYIIYRDSSRSIFRFVPPTTRIRILSIDRGGIRGIIPLIFLKYFNYSLI